MSCEALKQKVKASGENDCPDDDSTPLTFTVPCENKTLLDADIGVHATSYGSPGNGKPTKCILIAGDHGVPMEELINGMMNCIFGVEFKDDYRFRWLDDAVGWDWVKVQTIYHQDGSKVNHNMVVVFVPKYKPSMLDEYSKYFPAVEEYYYFGNANTVEDKKRFKLWGRDFTGMGKEWNLGLVGGGTKFTDHIESNQDDLKSFSGKKFIFPNPEILFLDHKEVGGEAQYTGNMQAYEQMLK